MKYCFYHSIDLDGMSSGAITKLFVPDVELIPYNYGVEFDFSKMTKKDTVYFVDVVIQPYEKLLKLFDTVKHLYIFDHHKTFLESNVYKILNEKTPEKLNCSTKLASCELTWQFFNKTNIPEAISLLGQYDSWRKGQEPHDWDKEVIPFQFGMKLNKFDFDDFIQMLDDGPFIKFKIASIINYGNVILKYQKEQNKITMEQSFDASIKGYKCICVNTILRNSQVFESKWDENKYDLMVAFSTRNDKKLSVSFYTTKDNVDVSKLAQQFGGGGHASSAGACVDHLNKLFG